MSSYKIFKEKAFVFVEFRGEVMYQDLLQLNIEVSKDPDYEINFNGIIDFREANLRVSVKEVVKIAEHTIAADSAKGRWAFLVSEPFDTALAKLYKEKISSLHPQAVYSTVDRAVTFLNYNFSDMEDIIGYVGAYR